VRCSPRLLCPAESLFLHSQVPGLCSWWRAWLHFALEERKEEKGLGGIRCSPVRDPWVWVHLWLLGHILVPSWCPCGLALGSQ
jgi:hypothetical protein